MVQAFALSDLVELVIFREEVAKEGARDDIAERLLLERKREGDGDGDD